MKKFLVVFTVTKQADKFHYRGIILLNGQNKGEFGQICTDYKEFENWYKEKCKQLSEGDDFRAIDQVILSEAVKQPYCYC